MQHHFLAALLAIAGFSVGLAAAEPLGIPSSPVEVKPIADADRTAPENTSGPFYAPVTYDGSILQRIVFRTEMPCRLELRLRRDGSAEETVLPFSPPDQDSYDHGVHLPALEPGAPYVARAMRIGPDGERTPLGDELRFRATDRLPETFPLSDGPWLFHAGVGRISVGWRSSVPLAGGIEYRRQGETEFREHFASRNSQLLPRTRAQIVDLDGLEPGAVYEYRLIAYDLNTGKKRVDETVCRFRTFSEEAKECRAVVFSDSHSNSFWVEKALRQARAAEEADFIVFNGDEVWDGLFLPDGELLMRDVVAPCLRAAGTEVPIVPVRGNHEYNGLYAADWNDYFRTPAGKTYNAFRQGPCHFTVFDCGPIFDFGLNRYRIEFLAEQRKWFQEQVLPSPEFRTAPFRVVLLHMATHGQNAKDGFYRRDTANAFADLLNGDTPETRIHLMLAGHTHSYSRCAAGGGQRLDEAPLLPAEKRPPAGETSRYAVVTGSGPNEGSIEFSALLLHADARKLTVTAFDQDCRVFDSFSITPDDPELKTFPSAPEKSGTGK